MKILKLYSLSLKDWQIVKNHFMILACALIFPAIFFSPLLLSPNPQVNFFADLYNLYFPQFVEGYHLAKNGTFAGIDFLTNNGASAYFLRPNIPVFYPVYQLIFFFFHFETIEGLARAFVALLYFHSVLAVYFCMTVGRKYFQMNMASSLLLAILYFGAIARSYPIVPFYFVASLFPIMLYFALRSVEETAWWRLVLYSFAYVLVFLSGYLPIDVNAILLALLFSIVYFWRNPNGNIKTVFVQLTRLFVPVALASLVVFPIYLAIMQYHALVPGVPTGVWHTAHELSYQSKDIFALFSRAFVASRPGLEFPSVIVGLAPVLLLALAFTLRKKIALNQVEARIMGVSIFIFVSYLLLAFGPASGLPDLFYFLVLGIGKMHMYGRFLMVASFFFFVTSAIVFRHLVNMRAELPIGQYLIAIFLVLFAVHGYSLYSQSDSIQPQVLVIELLMIILIVFAMSSRQSFYPYAAVIAVPFLIHAANFNSYINTFNSSSPPPYKNTVVFNSERRDSLRNYFKQYSDKKLIKFADITASIEKLDGVMANYPWLAQDTAKLSNYVGYELHTSIDRDYADRFWFGKTNVPWLLRTGADFVIYDSAAWNIFAGELGPWINHDVPELDIGYGYKAAKLKDASGLVDYIPGRTPGDFDNGIVRVSNSIGTATVSGFETDFASHVRFQVESTLAVSIRYLLFPNKLMELRVDGKRSDVILKDGLLDISLPPGRHQIEYQYKNRLHQFFIIEYILYIVLLLSILGWRAWLVVRPFLLNQKN
jgi:hypothetical protein